MDRKAGPVDIIIATWNNLPILQECVKSIRQCTDWPYQLYVINSGTDGTKEWLSQQPDIVTIHSDSRLHFSAAYNLGIEAGKNPYIVIANDDIIVSYGWLANLMNEAVKPEIAGVGGFSNCDYGWLHQESINIGGVDLHPGMKLDEVRHITPQIQSYRHEKVITTREWLAFYCTLIPRFIIDKAGPLDENFKSGCEDVDLCRRIAITFPELRFVTTFDAWIFHLGGSTRKNAEKFSYETHHREDRENHEYIARKYNQLPRQAPITSEPDVKKNLPNQKTFGLYTGAGWEKWDPKSIDEGGIGGSETCAIYVAKEFARRGYKSIVYGDPRSPGVYDGVEYRPHETINQFREEADIFISSRRPDVFQFPIVARKKICWVHDIWLHQDSKAYIFQDKIDKFFVLSPWHQGFFCGHHNIAEEKTYITRDAIDLSRFTASPPRIRGRMIYSSSPDRGLDVLLDCLPLIRQKVPEAHLKVFYGFNNWRLAVEARKNRDEIAWMHRIESQLKQSGVEYIGRIGQKQLATEFLQAELWGYPTAFKETFCLTACEAMAAGTPIVTSNLAALSTTVDVDGGVLIDGHNSSEAYRNSFVDVCALVLTNRGVWEELSARGKKKAAGLGWEKLVDEWIEELK